MARIPNVSKNLKEVAQGKYPTAENSSATSQTARERGVVSRMTPKQRQNIWNPTGVPDARNPAGYTPEQAFQYQARHDVAVSGVLGLDGSNKQVNPLAPMGKRPTGRQLQTFVDIYQEYLSIEDYTVDPERGGQYTNYGVEPGAGSDKSPSPLTVVPTSTTNPQRPRTVAAGFQATSPNGDGKLTVVFRDATFYNYYNVPLRVWQGFKTAPSKGQFIRTVLDYYERGPVFTDFSTLDARVQAVIKNVAAMSRVSQMYAYRKSARKPYRNKQATNTRYQRPGKPATWSKGARAWGKP